MKKSMGLEYEELGCVKLVSPGTAEALKRLEFGGLSGGFGV